MLIALFDWKVKFLAEIVERGIRNHPELGIGAQAETEGGARSVGNPPSLALSGLAQSLNLKAAIEYQEGNRKPSDYFSRYRSSVKKNYFQWKVHEKL